MAKELTPGKKAPAFSGKTQDNKVSLKDFKGENIVLYFYPKDNTPGCTVEACGFRDALPRFKRQNTRIVGVSKDSVASHCKFVEKFELSFPLISDEEGKICESYGTWVEKKLYGRTYMGIERATFLIDTEGKIAQIWRKVKVKNHVEDVLDAVKKLNKSNK
ncbi:MAG: thioredoxin-dependent thiol peroxidase [Alphaproteobacteria bacterium]|nr:thioredoxin-dependent thiol peroxidase [Alphaproteobacteria bacterium]